MANVEATQTTLGEFGPDGTGSVTASLSFSNPDPYGAAFSETYYLTVPEGNYYQISISADDEASASIGGASASSHWDAKSKSIIPGYAVSPWNDIPANSLQWSSEIYDSELDLVYYNYRHYSPLLGRFLSRDPIEEQGGLYAFVRNAPVKHIDIVGLQSVSPGCECPKEQQEPPIGIVFPEEDPDIFTNLLKEIFKELFMERALTNPDDYYFERMKDFSEFRKNEILVLKIGVGMKYSGFSGGGNVRLSPGHGWEPGIGAGPIPGGDSGEPGGFINIKITWRF